MTNKIEKTQQGGNVPGNVSRDYEKCFAVQSVSREIIEGRMPDIDADALTDRDMEHIAEAMGEFMGELYQDALELAVKQVVE
jgi:hypothetical protein